VNKRAVRPKLAWEILEATEEAAKAARIEHTSALNAALDRRGRLIAELFGLDVDRPLPPFKRGTARRPPLSEEERRLIEKAREKEAVLFRALDAQAARLNRESGTLRNGRQYMQGLRELKPSKDYPRMECWG